MSKYRTPSILPQSQIELFYWEIFWNPLMLSRGNEMGMVMICSTPRTRKKCKSELSCEQPLNLHPLCSNLWKWCVNMRYIRNTTMVDPNHNFIKGRWKSSVTKKLTKRKRRQRNTNYSIVVLSRVVQWVCLTIYNLWMFRLCGLGPGCIMVYVYDALQFEKCLVSSQPHESLLVFWVPVWTQ